jgi:AraC-like DNA-binding protein
MESLFFNTPNQRYLKSNIYKREDEYLTRVDVSNGVLFYDASIHHKSKTIKIQNLDRMVMIVVAKDGILDISNHIDNTKHRQKANTISIYCSSKQDFLLEIKGEVFLLFIADFFLKRYLSFTIDEPIDFLYEKIQNEVALEQINQQPTDALSLYIVNKIIKSSDESSMISIKCMTIVMEFITHRLSLLDMVDKQIAKEELELALRAKEELLANFATPPTIDELSHICATNTSKLKKSFKLVYKSTIYSYIQKLRLEEANLLLREEQMTIGEIAKRVGYRHQGHFSKLFFETYGVYPKDLLRR